MVVVAGKVVAGTVVAGAAGLYAELAAGTAVAGFAGKAALRKSLVLPGRYCGTLLVAPGRAGVDNGPAAGAAMPVAGGVRAEPGSVETGGNVAAAPGIVPGKPVAGNVVAGRNGETPAG